MTYGDIADYLGISTWTAGELVRSGEIPGRRVGRRVLATRSTVDRYLERRTE
ncbi:helix-turn-helix domain-containing protein [Myceligenerans indicum]|uniref:Helix-turn-helix domain-containing protein n=1 Tax=Myceligenerans indicum TaxID=2593663 RepID=A0ABS1LKX4_9MICO|nr:helix-turn-helix domain-containing protein [Myceligenerans indicum]MBL0886910.1 helix-turn-helix domain-containing protein [Myceligenerans indicum]